MKKPNIQQAILAVAENLIQTRGYNAFSYQDIARLVGVKTSSIHYYFPAKADLGKAVVKNQVEALCAELAQLKNNKKLSCSKKLELFFDSIFAKTYLADRKMCLGGMLASDVLTLPEAIQIEVRIFFNRIEDWLTWLLTEAMEKNEFSLEKKEIKSQAAWMLSTLEGALLLARLYQEEKRLIMVRQQMIACLKKR